MAILVVLAGVPLACTRATGNHQVPDSLTIRVTGGEFEWHVHYPGPDSEFGTADDVEAKQDLHVPVGTEISVELDSEDYIYRFRIPEFGVNEMAIPDLHFSAQFRPDSVGNYALRGDQMCGFSHSSLLGRVYVHSRLDYYAQLKRTER